MIVASLFHFDGCCPKGAIKSLFIFCPCALIGLVEWWLPPTLLVLRHIENKDGHKMTKKKTAHRFGYYYSLYFSCCSRGSERSSGSSHLNLILCVVWFSGTQLTCVVFDFYHVRPTFSLWLNIYSGTWVYKGEMLFGLAHFFICFRGGSLLKKKRDVTHVRDSQKFAIWNQSKQCLKLFNSSRWPLAES